MAAPKGRRSRRSSSDAKISRADIRKYQRLVDRQAEKGAAFVDRAVASYMQRNPKATVAEVRKFTYELMQDALPNFTDLAETLSCEFMEEVAARHGWDDVRPEIIGTTDYNLVNERLHYLAKNIAGGDAKKYREGVLDATRFYIRRAAQDSMVENCGKANLRFARVPSGFETCAFCFMLASRGFVYRSELKAGFGHAFHPNCNCTIVPGAEGRTKIDGYDPQGMADRWDMCLDTLGGTKQLKEKWSVLSREEKAKWLEKHNGSESAAREAWMDDCVMHEVETRDWHWLYTGNPPAFKCDKDADPDEFELEVGKILREKCGFNLEFKARSLKDRRADALIGRNKYELKNPEGAIPLTIHNQVKKNFYGSRKQKVYNPQSDRVIISNVRSNLSFNEMIRQAKEVLAGETGFSADELSGLTEIMIVDRSGRTRRLKR